MARCTECEESEGHDIDCTQYPNADTSGLYIYRIAEVEGLREENEKLRELIVEAGRDREGQCHWCYATEREGHYDDCLYQEVFGKGE